MSESESATSASGFYQSEIAYLAQELSAIRNEIADDSTGAGLEAIHGNYRDSARNFLHYLGLRRHDRRPLQMRLASLGLSSLGRLESHVLATLDSVLQVLQQLGQNPSIGGSASGFPDFNQGQRLLREHTEAVLGSVPDGRKVRIMVTMPTEAARDASLVGDLVTAGMDCMRINCAHDSALQWKKMVEHLRKTEQATGRSCRIAMDLAGPKLRTGPLEPGPKVIKIQPERDELGRVTVPARIWLSDSEMAERPEFPYDFRLPVSKLWLSQLHPGDQVRFVDARGARRELEIVKAGDAGCLAESANTSYVVPGMTLYAKSGAEEELVAAVGDIPAIVTKIPLKQGDLLVLKRDCSPGKPAVYADDGSVIEPPVIGCTIPEALEQVQAGEPVWFDDGKIGGVVEKTDERSLQVRITHTGIEGGKLAADKGLNFPGSDLKLGALTPKDLEDLEFVARHADIVELSFANTADDVFRLQQQLLQLGDRRPAIVLKVETQQGFRNLPEMLLAAMQWPACGVMIARGDLAVECGFERMAEIQEEILWICEAAHVPVIWATQVLETMAKEGMPSRAEITDAAMGDRAECVMLNKGPYVVEAVRALDDILRRMEQHQSKKCAMLRELHLARKVRVSGSGLQPAGLKTE
ncbi:MAG: hypothetical protein JW764_07010 [Chlorobiaceae bacterium]|nr:hypothetical protein [Chlorobiaceae bacterium]